MDDVIIPYGMIPPTIKSELKQEDLPSWDRDPKTVIVYFWKVQEQAMLGGYITAAFRLLALVKIERGVGHTRMVFCSFIRGTGKNARSLD